MKTLVRIDYKDTEGRHWSRVLKIMKRMSKSIIVQDPDDGRVFSIDRHAVEEIKEVTKEEREN